MNFKKRVNGSWADTPNYIHNTSTDTITTLPAVVYPNAATATVGLKGQTAQSSIPSPTSPVMPQGTGERTGNLVEVSNSNCIIYSTYNQFTITNDSINITGNALFGFIVKCSPNTQYTISSTRTGYNCDMRIREYSDKPSDWVTDFITQSVNVGSVTQSVSFTTNSATKYILVCFYGSNIARISNIMLNTGSTALPFEPFGVKIPISSASTTTPVYLVEVQTTRKIRKLVLTGEETIVGDIQFNRFLFTIPDMRSEGVRLTKLFCTHYQNISDGRPVADVPNNSIYTGGGADSQKVFIKVTDYTTDTAFKTYLAEQYAAGTPVTVWYVLATEETGIVNEPLMKIGEYVDELSDITIPTIAGANTISVGTTLQPSEVTVNYKGWHPVTDVHERDSGQWD